MQRASSASSVSSKVRLDDVGRDDDDDDDILVCLFCRFE